MVDKLWNTGSNSTKNGIRIVSLTSSASRCERTWSCFESVSLPTLCASINSNYVYITCDFRLLTKTKFAYAESYKKKKQADM